MARDLRFLWLLGVLGLGLAACGDSDKGSGKSGNTESDAGDSDASATQADAGSTKTDTGSAETCKVVVKDEDCDKTKRPFVFVHGTFGSGDNIANVALLFASNGYCADRFVAVEYNSLGGSPMEQLDALIDDVRKKTGAEQVELAGHSQGTGHCVRYLMDKARADKVAHYINYSGRGMVPNDVHTLSLSSDNDLGAMANHAPNAEKQVTFTGIDHFGVAATPEAFVATWNYLYGEDPKYTEIQCGGDPVTAEGIFETFADNTPIANGTLEVYELGTTPRESGKPVMTVSADDKGHLAPFMLKRLKAYEFKGLDSTGKMVGRVYYTPFKRSNRLMRFLAPASNQAIVDMTSGAVKEGPDHSAMVLRYLAGAFRHDMGDSLKVNGSEVLTDENAGRTTITVGLFMADQNENKETDLGVSFKASFIIGTDVYVDATKPKWIELDWKGQILKVPNYPSENGGMLSITFQ
jgi:hypothetical protein